MENLILIVEDNMPFRTLLSYIINKKYEIYPATNGLEALLFLRKGFIPDLIITDMMMPEIDGLDLVRNLKKSGLYHHIPIIVLTGITANHVLDELRLLGVDNIFEKPFDPQKLLEYIDKKFINVSAA